MTQESIEGLFPEEIRHLNDALASSWRFVRVLGRGQYGIVSLVENIKTGVGFSVKTISAEANGRERDEKIASLATEIRFLKKSKHKCLPTIIDYKDGAQGYYISDYHPGIQFSEFIKKSGRIAWSDSEYILGEIVSVLRYIHSERGPHCDLHLKNIMIGDSDVRNNGVMLIDFGQGQIHSDQKAKSGSDQRHMGDMSFADFQSFANLMTEAGDIFCDELDEQGKREYRQLAEDIKRNVGISWSGITHRLNLLRHLTRTSGRILDLVYSQRLTQSYISLPVTKRVRVGESILKIINTKEFQRLRGIPQLSFCDWEFPGARHSRFEHSLGVMELAMSAAEHLLKDGEFAKRYDEQILRSFVISALLHDIGHYPFAHVVEQFQAAKFPGREDIRNQIHHGRHGKRLIAESEDLSRSIREVCGEAGVKNITDIWDGKYPALSSLVDGPMDLDKMDYLARDSHHVGVSYGQGFDAGSLIYHLGYVPGKVGDDLIGVHHTGLSSIEGFSVLQDQMLTGVYWHPVVRSQIARFQTLLALMCWKPGTSEMDENRFLGVAQDVMRSGTEVDALTALLGRCNSKGGMPDWDSNYQGEQMKIQQYCIATIEHFLHPNYTDSLLPIARFQRNTADHEEMSVWDSIFSVDDQVSRSSRPIDSRRITLLRSAFKKAITEYISSENAGRNRRGVPLMVEIKSWEALKISIDVPVGKSTHKTIIVIDDGGNARPIHELSHIPKRLFDEPAAFNSPISVFVEPSHFFQLRAGLEIIKISAISKYFKLIQ